ncbi:MAG TPA: histidine triad nucleotide-binding protein [Alphaproteobacteria bacterium]
MAYDPNNVFAKIIRGEIPCKKVYEDDHVLAFHDIHPRRKIHVMIIPKGPHENASAFGENATDAEIVALWRAIPKIAAELGMTEKGYRLVTNCGEHGHQEVPHLHFHMLGGEPVGHLVSPL